MHYVFRIKFVGTPEKSLKHSAKHCVVPDPTLCRNGLGTGLRDILAETSPPDLKTEQPHTRLALGFCSRLKTKLRQPKLEVRAKDNTGTTHMVRAEDEAPHRCRTETAMCRPSRAGGCGPQKERSVMAWAATRAKGAMLKTWEVPLAPYTCSYYESFTETRSCHM